MHLLVLGYAHVGQACQTDNDLSSLHDSCPNRNAYEANNRLLGKYLVILRRFVQKSTFSQQLGFAELGEIWIGVLSRAATEQLCVRLRYMKWRFIKEQQAVGLFEPIGVL